jgi:multiple antibiotic resistance protein
MSKVYGSAASSGAIDSCFEELRPCKSGRLFSTLLPMIAPMGASLQIFTLVGLVPDPTYRILARRIAINNIILLSIVEVLGSAILTFFGISIPIIEIAGGGVIAAIGWRILHQSDEVPSTGAKNAVARGSEERNMITLSQQMLYPFTFPILSGPGAIVAMLTLSARASRPSLSANLIGHIGIFVAVVIVSAMFYFCCAPSSSCPQSGSHVRPMNPSEWPTLISSAFTLFDMNRIPMAKVMNEMSLSDT